MLAYFRRVTRMTPSIILFIVDEHLMYPIHTTSGSNGPNAQLLQPGLNTDVSS